MTFKARRFALRKEPPAVFLEYQDAVGKTRVRTVHLNKLSPADDAHKLTQKVIRAFPRKLDPSSLKQEQIFQLVERLLQHANSPLLIPSTTPKLPPSHLKPEEEDEEEFEADFIEEEVEEEPEEEEQEEDAPWAQKPAPMQVQEPLADDLDDMLADLDRELGSGGGSSTKQAPLPPIPAPAPVAPPSSIPRFNPPPKKEEEEDSDFLVLDVDLGGDVDLNKVTDIELKMAKQKMDEEFSKNRLKPGDPGFEYDKQIEFGPPTAKNEWDDDDDDDEAIPPPKLPQPMAATAPPPPASQSQPQPQPTEDDDDRYSYGNDIDRVMEDDDEEEVMEEDEEIDDELEGAGIGFDGDDDDDVFGDDAELELP